MWLKLFSEMREVVGYDIYQVLSKTYLHILVHLKCPNQMSQFKSGIDQDLFGYHI